MQRPVKSFGQKGFALGTLHSVLGITVHQFTCL